MKSLIADNRVVAIIQGRMGSTRLPGKTLMDISGKPLLAHIIDRVKTAQTVQEVVVATTIDPEDQAILEFARSYGVRAYAGSPEDVLDRYYQAAKEFGADTVVRITADDPFKDPEVADKIVHYLLDHPQLDYASNTIEPTYPEGLDIEVFTFRALAQAWREAKLPSEREHVTPYIWKNPDKFRVANIKLDRDLSHLRWTLDYEADLLFTREIYHRFYQGQVFLMHDILSLLAQEPDLTAINQGIPRNLGYEKSRAQEAESAAEDLSSNNLKDG